MAKSRATSPAKSSPRKAPPARKPAAKALKPIFPGSRKAVPTLVVAVSKKPKQEFALVDAKKPKLVRDSFSIPKNEYAVLGDLKKRAQALGRQVKKSELLRAGLSAIAAMGDAAFVAAIDVVPRIKTGRPKDSRDAGKA